MRAFSICMAVGLACLAAPQSISLRPKFVKGRADRVVSTVRTVQTIGTPGTSQGMTITSDETITGLMRVVDAGPHGATLRMTYEAINVKSTMNGKPMPGATNMAEALKGMALTLKFSPEGKIVDVEGMDKMMAATKTEPPAMRQLIEQMLSGKTLRDSMNLMYGGLLSGRPVRIGDHWASHLSIGQPPIEFGMNFNSSLLRVAARKGRRLADIRIIGSGTMKMSNMEALPGASVKTDRFAITGTTSFDLDLGWFSDQHLDMQIHATLKMDKNGQHQTMPLSVHMTMTSASTPVR